MPYPMIDEIDEYITDNHPTSNDMWTLASQLARRVFYSKEPVDDFTACNTIEGLLRIIFWLTNPDIEEVSYDVK